MKIVIDIPEEDFKEILEDNSDSGTEFENRIWKAIQNGTPLNEYIDKAFDDLNKCKCGSSYIVINGETYRTDMGYAFEGIELFIKYLKGTLSQTESEEEK